MSTLETPLVPVHRQLGAKLTEFGGWLMPLQYQGIIEEHRAVRSRAGLFDISHMGKVEVRGPRPVDFLQGVTANDVSRLAINQAQYSFLLQQDGGVIDDIIVYRLPERFLVVVNAGTRPGDLEWLREHAGAEVQLDDRTEEWGMLALQGPEAQSILQSLTDIDLASVRYYRAAEGQVAGHGALVLRTGYTGEDGFEIIVDADRAEAVWQALATAGPTPPCGLGARDTLRLEAGMPLYGHELDRQTTPVEAGLERFVAFDKDEFIGKQALIKSREHPAKRLVGLKMAGRAVPRSGYPVLLDGSSVGSVTSGSYAPTLEASIAMAYVQPDQVGVGGQLDVVIRERPEPAVVVELPFYRRPRG